VSRRTRRMQAPYGEEEAGMKKACVVIYCLAWLFPVCSFEDVFSAELIFKDAPYSFQTLRALGYAVSQGADIGEVLTTAYSIEEGDDESWYQQWFKTAQQREKAGDDFLERGRRMKSTSTPRMVHARSIRPSGRE
jgi:hypothetical protein